MAADGPALRRLRCVVCGHALPAGAPAGVCTACRPITSNLRRYTEGGCRPPEGELEGRLRDYERRAAARLPLFPAPRP
jgi:hypothetical protein